MKQEDEGLAPSPKECQPPCHRDRMSVLSKGNTLDGAQGFPNSQSQQMPLTDGDILTPKDLCSVLHLSEGTVYQELRCGFLAPIAVRVGRQYRVSSTALYRLMNPGG
jgi:excisionase family DNA binding protein